MLLLGYTQPTVKPQFNISLTSPYGSDERMRSIMSRAMTNLLIVFALEPDEEKAAKIYDIIVDNLEKL